MRDPGRDWAIRAAGLSKLYRRTSAGHRLRTLKSALVERSLTGGLDPKDAITALQDVAFEVPHGQALGLIGSNGSGKSTLLKLIARILRPTAGSVEVQGRTAALIELGAGFHPEISGRENVFIGGAVMGLSRRQIARRFDDIVAFSGLEDFIDEPVKTYSSGMYVRLGFAVAIHTEPDVLLVDEVLAVGDEAFAHRCLRRIEEHLAAGCTLVMVSHSLSLIEDICDRALWLEKGTLREDGAPRRVVDAYRQSVAEAEGRLHHQAKQRREAEEAQEPPTEAADENGVDEAEILRWGSGDARLVAASMRVGDEERYHMRSGEGVTFEVEVRVRRPLEDFVFGIAIATPRGIECWGTNTDLAGFQPDRLEAGTTRVSITCPGLRLAPGEYLVDLAVHARDGAPYDYRKRWLEFSVTASGGGVGVYRPEHHWSFGDGIRWEATP